MATDFFAQYNTGNTGQSTLPPLKVNYLNGPPKVAAPQAGGVSGFLQRAGKSLLQAPKYFGENVVNSVKQTSAQLTGNKQALQNANAAERKNLVGGNSNNASGALKTLAGNTAQLATLAVAPEVKAGIAGKVYQGAKLGAVAGGGSALANNQNVATGAVEGAAMGGVANGILGKVLGGKPAPSQDSAQVLAAKQASGFKNPVASAGAQAKKYGTDLLANKLNIKPTDAVKFNGPETVARLQQEHGLTVHQAAQLHPVVTGGEGATTVAMDNALEGMGKVNFRDFATKMQSHINDPEYQAANLPDGVSSAQGKNLQAVINKYHTALNPQSENPLLKSTTGPQIDTGTNAKSAMDIAKNLEKEGYKNQSSATPNKQALSDLQLKMADNIKSTIFNSPGGQTALEGAKADAVNNLSAISKASGNTKLASVAKAISDAPDFPAYRNVSQPFVNAKQLVDKSNLNDFANAGNNTGKGGIFSTAKSATSKVVSPIGGKVLSNVGNKITNTQPSGGFLSKFINPNVANAATRAGAVGSAAAVANPSKGGQSSNNPTSDVTNMVSNLGGGQSTTPQTNDPFNSDNIKAAILQDMAENGGKNISALVSLYNTFGKSDNAQSTTEKNTVDSLHSALATLNTYNDQLNASGGGRGAIGGNVENFLGKFSLGGSSATNVRAIESQKTDVATSIAKALTGGKPSSAQIKSWEDAIPNATDSASVAKQKMANITASIQSKLQTLGVSQ